MIQRLRRPSGLDQCPGFTYARGSMFYSGRDVAHGYELWKSDGTVDGTVIVKDIARGSDSSSPSNLVHVGNEVLFAVFSPRFALWASNGTRVGTRIVHRLHEWYSPLSSNPVLGGRMFYYTYEGGYGAEPWVTDGTRERTVMVKDINPGPPDSSPLGATAFGHALFFMADDGEHGYELRQTEGGEAGASLVMDIQPGPEDGWPDHLIGSGGVLLFGADDGIHGYELWTSDGTPTGTSMLKDIDRGAESAGVSWVCATPSSDRCFALR